jgi:hypothetical protein
MADVDERLVPRDGLNSYNVVLARMDLVTRGSANFTFAVTSALLPVAELNVEVAVTGQSLDRMTVEAHDALIDILRQLVFRAETARRHHERNAQGERPVSGPAVQEPPPTPDSAELDPRFATGLRINGIDPGFDPGFERIGVAEPEPFF